MLELLNRNLAELKAELAESRTRLLAARNQRIWPSLDDKVLVSWNGLMIDAMAQAGERAWRAAICRCCDASRQLYADANAP